MESCGYISTSIEINTLQSIIQLQMQDPAFLGTYLVLGWKSSHRFYFYDISFSIPSSSKAQKYNTKCTYEEIKEKANIPRC